MVRESLLTIPWSSNCNTADRGNMPVRIGSHSYDSEDTFFWTHAQTHAFGMARVKGQADKRLMIAQAEYDSCSAQQDSVQHTAILILQKHVHRHTWGPSRESRMAEMRANTCWAVSPKGSTILSFRSNSMTRSRVAWAVALVAKPAMA